MCIIKHQNYCSNTAAGTATIADGWFPTLWSDFMWCIVGGEVLKNGGGGLLLNLMLEGDPEVHFTSPSAISHSHRASAPAERSSRPVCGRESGPRNLEPQSNANFQFNTLRKQESAHTEHSGQEPLERDLS